MLRSIAGLERPVAGGILIDGQPVFSTSDKIFVPPDRRPIAMVFQSYAIWPHMDVFENVAFPLRRGRARLGQAELQERVAEVLELLGLETMADRPVTTLSGGQQQRVALARALALRPRVLLMDEPLSNLDFKLQVRLRAQMRELMHRLGLTTIHVTHNQAEALETGDRIAVMDLGKVSQIGDPQTIYHSPENEFVARFIGDMNIYEGTFHAQDGADALVDTPFGRLRARVTAKERFNPGDDCAVGIRPEDIQMNGAVPADGGNEVFGNCTAVELCRRGFRPYGGNGGAGNPRQTASQSNGCQGRGTTAPLPARTYGSGLPHSRPERRGAGRPGIARRLRTRSSVTPCPEG